MHLIFSKIIQLDNFSNNFFTNLFLQIFNVNQMFIVLLFIELLYFLILHDVAFYEFYVLYNFSKLFYSEYFPK